MATTYDQAEKIEKNIKIFLGRLALYGKGKGDRTNFTLAGRASGLHDNHKFNRARRLLRLSAVSKHPASADRFESVGSGREE